MLPLSRLHADRHVVVHRAPVGLNDPDVMQDILGAVELEVRARAGAGARLPSAVQFVGLLEAGVHEVIAGGHGLVTCGHAGDVKQVVERLQVSQVALQLRLDCQLGVQC